MKEFDIWVDSTSDLDAELCQKYNIRFICGHLSFDGKEVNATPTWDFMPRETFYAELKKNPARFKTAPPSVGEFALAFENSVAAGKDVLFLTISGALSGTCNFAEQGRALALEKYPEAKILCVDSRRFGPAIGLMAINCALLRDTGKTLDEVYSNVEENKNRYHQAGWLDDLSFVAKQGRLTHAKAFFGTLVGIKPIGEFDYNGLTTVLGKAKGEKAALDVILNYIRKTIEKPEEQIVFVAQTNRLKQAEKLKAMIEETIRPKEVCICQVYANCGTNVGPGLMAAYYLGTPISKDLEIERNIIKESLEGTAL